MKAVDIQKMHTEYIMLSKNVVFDGIIHVNIRNTFGFMEMYSAKWWQCNSCMKMSNSM